MYTTIRTLLLLLSFPAIALSQPTYSYWPNPISHTNSDEWLRKHHAEIKLLQPRVLVLIADNQANPNLIDAFVKQAIYATAEGSRYHGYSDPKASVQLLYQVLKTVDLRDKATTRWPAIWPMRTDSKGRPQFVYDGLFSPEMAKALGFPDPADPAKFLNLRELFEHGIINEVWMVYPEIDGQPGNGSAGVFETTARVQVYDKDDNAVQGKFRNCGGNGCFDPGPRGQSKVTMRFAELNTSLGVGCFTHATGHGWDTGLWRAVPEFDDASARFFNRKLDAQGLPMESLYDKCPGDRTGDCWAYPNDHTLINGPLTKSLEHFKDDHWGQGCGSVHFPPNGRHHDDYDNTEKVKNSCENYALKNGSNGADVQTDYKPNAKIAEYEKLWGDCGGGWQIYMRQSFPGYGTQAKNADGTSMKSWWPYLYY